MKKTIGILILAVILVFSLTSCGGGGGGSGLSSLINKVTGKNDNASKNNFAGRNFGDHGIWAGGNDAVATLLQFGTGDSNAVTVTLEGVSKGACTYNKPTGLSNVNLVIKDASQAEIVNWTVNFADDGHSFNVTKKSGSGTATFSMY